MIKNAGHRLWIKFRRQNSTYHKDLEILAGNIIPPTAKVIEFGCKGGELISGLPNGKRVGVDKNDFVKKAKRRYKKIKFCSNEEISKELNGEKFDYIYISNYLADIEDIQKFIHSLKKFCHKETRIVIVYFNYLWKPLIDIGAKVGLVYPWENDPNWLSAQDLDNFFYLESFERIRSGSRFLFPFDIPVLSSLMNRFVSQIPIFNLLCLTGYAIYKPVPLKKEYSVSLVIPARNEEGNVRGLLKKIPSMGRSTEVIFVEGHSNDATYEAIEEEIKIYKGRLKPRLVKQKGVGKGSAVREGFKIAKNELLIVFDADLTVSPEDLPKFYKAASLGLGDLIMGSRLIYPMEKLAMRTLNTLGNKFFSVMFTFLLGQSIRDTLCGTKVITRSKYAQIEENRKLFGDFDPFGDFDLIFGSAKLNYKILEVPVRYRQRTYGMSNISRFTHGWLLLKMVFFAVKNLKFI